MQALVKTRREANGNYIVGTDIFPAHRSQILLPTVASPLRVIDD